MELLVLSLALFYSNSHLSHLLSELFGIVVQLLHSHGALIKLQLDVAEGVELITLDFDLILKLIDPHLFLVNLNGQ